MLEDVEKTSQEAIEAALTRDWKKAIVLNKDIVEFDDQNIQALNRLAKAYLELEKYEEAKKTLKAVLKLDPINSTAKRNMDYALAKKKSLGTSPLPDIRTFIKEPGISKQLNFSILTKGLTADKFYVGEMLDLKVDGHKVLLRKTTGELISILDNNNAEKVIMCKNKGESVIASFMSGSEKEVAVLLKASLPLFKSEKQEVKPYLKRDNLEETEVEATPVSDTEEV